MGSLLYLQVQRVSGSKYNLSKRKCIAGADNLEKIRRSFAHEKNTDHQQGHKFESNRVSHVNFLNIFFLITLFWIYD